MPVLGRMAAAGSSSGCAALFLPSDETDRLFVRHKKKKEKEI